MDNSEKNMRIFAPSGCLEKEALLAYLAGHTDAHQTRAIEMHLADCPLCSDAADGLALMNDRDRLETLLQEARPEEAAQEPKEFVLPVTWGKRSGKHLQRNVFIGIAASIALLLASYFFVKFPGMRGEKKETLSLETPVIVGKNKEANAPFGEKGSAAKGNEKASLPATATTDSRNTVQKTVLRSEQTGEGYFLKREGDDADETKNNLTGLAKSDYTGDNSETFYTGIEKTEEVTAADKLAETKEKDVTIPVAAAEERSTDAETTVTTANVQRPANRQAYKKESKAVEITRGGVGRKEVAAQEQSQNQNSVDKGLIDYKKGAYADASGKFDQALRSDPDLSQALYYKGMSCYYLHQYDEALKMFQRELGNKNSQYHEAAQWQVAVIYIETGNVRLARKILNEIIDRNGLYRNAAEEAIKNLGNR